MSTSKPARVRPAKVEADPQRRRNDAPPVVVAASAAKGARPAGTPARGLPAMVLAGLFVLAAVGGGIATELLLPS